MAADSDERRRRAEQRIGSSLTPAGHAALDALCAGRAMEVRDPARWVPWVDAARRAWSEDGRPPVVSGLPPCLQLARRPIWPTAPTPVTDRGCAAADACPAVNCAHRGTESAQDPRPLRHGDALTAVRRAVAEICAAWGHSPAPAFADWLTAMLDLNPAVDPARFEFSLKRVGDRVAPRLRVVDLDSGAPDSAAGAARRARVADWFAAQSSVAVGAAAREFIDLFTAHHGPRPGLSVGLDAPLNGGPARRQLYAHQSFGDQAPNRAHMLVALRWAGANEAELERMATLVAKRAVALVVFAPGAGNPRGIKVYVGAPFELAVPEVGLPAQPPLDYAVDPSLAVWRCDAGGLAWEKRDFPSAAHPQRSEAVVADFVDGLTSVERKRTLALLDGRAFLPWYTWNSVRPGTRTLYFHAR